MYATNSNKITTAVNSFWNIKTSIEGWVQLQPKRKWKRCSYHRKEVMYTKEYIYYYILPVTKKMEPNANVKLHSSGCIFDQQIKLKQDSPKSRFAKWWISPALTLHAQLLQLLLNSSSFVFGFRSGKSVLLPTMHLQMSLKTWCWLVVLCWLLVVGRPLHWNFWSFWLFLRDFHFLDNHGSADT